MLKVPSVDDSVEYWTEDVGGKIRISRPLENDDGDSTSRQSLMSAFVELGCSKRNDKDADVTSPVCFALELVRAKKENYLPGNVISYIGVSMLLQFENNLLGVITGDEAPKEQAEEPNGIAVKSSASAPGDYFARFALKTNNLEATHAFYTGVLGMECKAEDATMVCLRYENETFQAGVSTTLVFDATDEELVKGDCFDHIAITTDASIAVIFDKLEGEKVFMKPTEMFGKQVLGLLDPNGYKVVVAGI
jgi:catechol 2,3-dioxygenase-like lactoylglutathione lyase family enzyme